MAVKYVDSKSFDQEISTGLVLVDFFAEWCAPCKMLSPILEELDKEITNLNVVKIDVDANNDIAAKYQVMAMPTLFLFKDGVKIDQSTGFKVKEDLKTWIESK